MKIDVVVPIYNAYDALKNCLLSLQKHQQHAETITLINDASTDARITPLLKVFSQRNNWQLRQHQRNLGFVATANEALNLSTNNTILLNSDTIVSKYWLAAFKQSLKQVENLGTATAWSNNAEICSFPYFLKNNKRPAEVDILSDIIYKSHQPQYPTIPTAVGFCMLVSAQAKAKVGTFDEQHFGHGYGEENDYSLRVTQAGLLNIVCDNAYVIHLGNESFADLGLQPNEETMQRLLQKHPNYLDEIHSYINDDPMKQLRQQMLQLIRNNNHDLYRELTDE
jgi:GT2 family glycosyltransferase